MGFAMAHYSMGFAMHYSKEKFRKLSPKTDTCDCRLHFHSAWNVFCIAALLQTLPQHIYEMLVFGLKIFILVKKFEGSQKKEKKGTVASKCPSKNYWPWEERSWQGNSRLQRQGGWRKKTKVRDIMSFDTIINIIINIVINIIICIILIKSTFIIIIIIRRSRQQTRLCRWGWRIHLW